MIVRRFSEETIMQPDGSLRGRRPFLRRIIALVSLLAVPAGIQARQEQRQAGSEPKGSPKGLIFAGIQGSVVAIEQATGNLSWHTHLTGGDFVNVVVAGGSIYASTRGEIYCIDTSTGQIRWHNQLKGYGRGLMTMATAEVAGNQAAVIQARRHQQEEEAAAAQPPM